MKRKVVRRRAVENNANSAEAIKIAKKDRFGRLKTRLRALNWRKISWRAGLAAVIILLLVQIFYSSDRMLPFAKIAGFPIGGQTKSSAIDSANQAYKEQKIEIFTEISSDPVVETTIEKAGIKIDSTEAINAVNYPWFLRLVPTSIFWAGLGEINAPDPQFSDDFEGYVVENIMPRCTVAPTDATLKAEGDKLKLVESKLGGECEQKTVIENLKSVQLSPVENAKISVTQKKIEPSVSNDTAQKLAEILNERLADGVAIKIKNEDEKIEAKTVLGWLAFVADGENLIAKVDGELAQNWLEEVSKKVAVKPGVSQITTKDFTEISRSNGASGVALDVDATIEQLQKVVDGENTKAEAVTKIVPPTEQYTRTYSASDAGLSALMKNFANDHPGEYGVSMIELDGKKRRAEYNGDKQFVTASTYKLFVAYSLLKRIDSGARSWASDETCFNKMISQSDNACAEGFLNSLGLKNVTSDINAIGLKNSTFMKSGGPFTTANDQALLLGMIATGQNFSRTNQQRLIGAMRNNVYRSGIPAGVSGSVADKVGFLNGLLHDSAIVYGANGTYVLSIMTDGSSWANIAELARQLDKLHAQ